MGNVILIHGGVGSKGRTEESLNGIVENSISENALDSVMKSVIMLEDDPRFNAGTGSVIRIDGSIEMDAAVAIPGDFGAVINIKGVRNPVLVARDVMEKTPHIAIAGEGAVKFARRMGFEDYHPETERTRENFKKMKEALLNAEEGDDRYTIMRKLIKEGIVEEPHDTVGAVARINGKFAAAVSTGGASPMMSGRVGDVPLIGAGIYCGENGAVVATGIGEEIAKRLLCYRIYSRIGETKLSKILEEEIDYFNGKTAGAIAVSRDEVASNSNGVMPTDQLEF
jgi:Asparaginase